MFILALIQNISIIIFSKSDVYLSALTHKDTGQGRIQREKYYNYYLTYSYSAEALTMSLHSSMWFTGTHKWRDIAVKCWHSVHSCNRLIHYFGLWIFPLYSQQLHLMYIMFTSLSCFIWSINHQPRVSQSPQHLQMYCRGRKLRKLWSKKQRPQND